MTTYEAADKNAQELENMAEEIKLAPKRFNPLDRFIDSILSVLDKKPGGRDAI